MYAYPKMQGYNQLRCIKLESAPTTFWMEGVSSMVEREIYKNVGHRIRGVDEKGTSF